MVNGHHEKPDAAPLTLQRSQELMQMWSECQKGLVDRFTDVTTLVDALNDFKQYFFATMQQGFCDKELSLKTQIVESIGKCLNVNPDDMGSSSHWVELRGQLDDYMRLSTAEVFDTTTKDKMKTVASSADYFWSLAYHSSWDVMCHRVIRLICFWYFFVLKFCNAGNTICLHSMQLMYAVCDGMWHGMRCGRHAAKGFRNEMKVFFNIFCPYTHISYCILMHYCIL